MEEQINVVQKKVYKKTVRVNMDYVALGIIAVCLILIGMNELLNPAKVIERAATKSLNEYSTRETANIQLLDNGILQSITKSDVSLDFGGEITDGSYPYDDALTLQKGTGFKITVDKDSAAKKAQLNTVINYGEDTVLDLKAYSADNKFTVSAPVLYDKNIIFNTSDFSKDIYSMSGVDFDAESTDADFIFDDNFLNNLLAGKLSVSDGSALAFALKDSAFDAIQANKGYDMVSIEKQEINNLKCKGYEINFDSTSAKAVLKSFVENYMGSSALKDKIAEQAEAAYNANAMMYQLQGISGPDALAEMAIQNMQEQYLSIIENCDIDAASIQLFINGGRLIKVDAGLSLSAMNTPLELSAVATFTGDNKPTDTMEASFGVSSEGNQQVTSIADSNIIDGSNTTTLKTVTNRTEAADSTDNVYITSFSTAFDADSNNVSISSVVTSDDTELSSIKANGTVSFDGTNTDAELSDISFSQGGAAVCKAKLHLNIHDLENEITPLEGDAEDLSDSESEESTNKTMEVMQKVYENLANIRVALGGTVQQ